MDTMIAHCHKPIYVGAVTEAGIQRAREIHEIRGNITVQFSIINSPLNIMEGQIAPFLSCIRQGIPIYVSTMPMAGLSAPYSMSGLLPLTHAEALFGITLAQVVNPGCTVVHAGFTGHRPNIIGPHVSNCFHDATLLLIGMGCCHSGTRLVNDLQKRLCFAGQFLIVFSLDDPAVDEPPAHGQH